MTLLDTRPQAVDSGPRGTVTERLVGWVSRRIAPAPEADAAPGPPRRSFLGGAALVGAAVAASPWGYLTRPANAYDAICGSGNTCGDGWSVFCCTVNGGQNSCPPDSFIGGWWKADHSSFCGGSARYYIDCNAFRGGPWRCSCNQTSCDQRLVACNQFRYGQCNLQVPYSNTGPVVCRVVSCTPPWVQFGGVCTSSSATDNNTATHSAPCLVATPTTETAPPRIAVLTGDGVAVVKAGSLYADWVTLADNTAAMAVTVDRVGVVDRSGVLRVKQGGLDAGWVVVADSVASVALDGTRLAALGTDGVLRVKDGALNAGWLTLADDVTAVSVDGSRVAVLQRGVVFAKEGSLTAPWVRVADNVTDVVLEGTRMAVLRGDGSVLVRDGALDAPWTAVASNVTSVTLDGSRIGVVTADGWFLVKEGPLNASWQTVGKGVAQGVVRGDRVATVDTGGTVVVKEGPLTAPWVTEWTGARSVRLS